MGWPSIAQGSPFWQEGYLTEKLNEEAIEVEPLSALPINSALFPQFWKERMRPNETVAKERYRTFFWNELIGIPHETFRHLGARLKPKV